MAFLGPLVMGYLRSNWRNLIVVGAVVAALLVVYLRGRHDEHASNEAHRKVAEAAAQKLDTKADQKSTDALEHDAAVIAAKQKELEDAVAKVPDTIPDAVAVAAGCRELQQHGVGIADLPACRPAGK